MSDITSGLSMDNLKQRAREGYLAYRLNQPELIEVTAQMKAAEAGQVPLDSVAHTLDQYVEVTTDWRGQPSSGTLPEATQYLGMDKEFAALRQDVAWTPYQRALYRRTTTPEFDPKPGASAEEAHSGNPELVKQAKAVFPRCDTNQDGHVTPVELDQAMSGGKFLGAEAAVVVSLRRNGPQLGTCVDDGEGVTTADLESFQANGVPHDSKTTAKLNRGFAGLVKQAQVIEQHPALPIEQENFDPLEVFQGRAGSCVMLSTQAGVSAADIKEMFHDNHDGTVQVTFRDGVVETVKDLTVAERLYHARTADEGRWPGLAEMAMGQRLFHTKPSDDGSIRTRVNGQPIEVTIPAFGGFTCKKYKFDGMAPDQLRTTLTKLDAFPGPKVCASRSTPKGDDSKISIEELHNGIANNHAYTYRGYNPSTDEVSLRNPWHKGEWTIKGDGKNDGLFTVPLLEFYSSYQWVAGPAIPEGKPA